MKKIVNIEFYLEGTPSYLKKIYLAGIYRLKKLLQITGILPWLDKHATQSSICHYLRSLFAIHLLEDMVALDVPWWTYSAINYLNDYLKNQKNPIHVFEYGSGASTVWLSKRCQSVTSVEHDPIWYNKLKHYLNKHNHNNVNLHLINPTPCTLTTENIYLSKKIPNIDFKPYVDHIQFENRQFDVIIIDGRCRTTCLLVAMKQLKPHGIMIFDNSNRQRYQKALNQNHIKIKRLKGRVPGSPFKSETAILTWA